jgi:hypothetical protein
VRVRNRVVGFIGVGWLIGSFGDGRTIQQWFHQVGKGDRTIMAMTGATVGGICTGRLPQVG